MEEADVSLVTVLTHWIMAVRQWLPPHLLIPFQYQLVLEGDEQMGWKPLADCHNPVSEHSDERDIRFFHDAPASWVAVPPDHFCIFFPEDAHAPLVASGQVRKVIFKVAVNPTL